MATHRPSSYSALSLPEVPDPIDLGDLQLGPFQDNDVPLLLDIFADDAMLRWNPGPGTPDDAEAWLSRRNDWSSGDYASWAMRGRDGDLLGSVSLHHLDWEQLDAELGYWVAPWARRRRIGVRGVAGALGYAFDRMSMHRVHLYHDVANEPSCRLAVSLGMRQEGVLQQSYRNVDGGYHDEHLHAVLADELREAEP